MDVPSHLTRALTANRTTVERRKRGVTRMWKRAREAKASEGVSLELLRYAWVTNVCTPQHSREQKNKFFSMESMLLNADSLFC